MINKIIGFIGCGNMGKAMLGSLISSGEIKKENIIVSAKTEASKEALEKEFEVKATNDNKEVAAKANIIFLAVKPHFFQEVIAEIRDVVSKEAIIVSIAAGVTIEQIEEYFGFEVKLIRTMPNTPALVGEGMSAICKNKNIHKEELEEVCSLFNYFGKYELLVSKLDNVEDTLKQAQSSALAALKPILDNISSSITRCWALVGILYSIFL